MKGFPNQVSDLTKLADGMRAAVEVTEAGADFGDDGVYGPALVHSGVAGTGHRPRPVEQYIAAQRKLRRHNLLVRSFASKLAIGGSEIFEDPFDILVLTAADAVLVEVKTLDGSAADERHRVRDALAQLLYYEAFVTKPVAGELAISKVACFELKPSYDHIAWLNSQGIGVVWQSADGFEYDAPATALFGRLGVVIS